MKKRIWAAILVLVLAFGIAAAIAWGEHRRNEMMTQYGIDPDAASRPVGKPADVRTGDLSPGETGLPDREQTVALQAGLEAAADLLDESWAKLPDRYRLTVGETLHFYTLTAEGLRETGRGYPVFSNNGKILRVVMTCNGEAERYEVSLLAQPLVTLQTPERIAFLYDSAGIWLFDGESFTLLGESGLAGKVGDRAALDPENPPDASGMILCTLSSQERLYPDVGN